VELAVIIHINTAIPTEVSYNHFHICIPIVPVISNYEKRFGRIHSNKHATNRASKYREIRATLAKADLSRVSFSYRYWKVRWSPSHMFCLMQNKWSGLGQNIFLYSKYLISVLSQNTCHGENTCERFVTRISRVNSALFRNNVKDGKHLK